MSSLDVPDANVATVATRYEYFFDVGMGREYRCRVLEVSRCAFTDVWDHQICERVPDLDEAVDMVATFFIFAADGSDGVPSIDRPGYEVAVPLALLPFVIGKIDKVTVAL